jgi:hypothetical protein
MTEIIKVAVITNAVFGLLKNNANNNSQTSKVKAFNANSIGRQAYNMALFSETHLRFMIFIGLTVKTGTKAGFLLQLREVFLTDTQTYHPSVQ